MKPSASPGQYKSSRRVLVFPGPTLLAREFLRSLSGLPNYEVIGAGQDASFPWKAGFKEYFVIPALAEPRFLDHLVNVVEAAQISHILPANDAALMTLQNLPINLSDRLVSHPRATVETAGSKEKTWDFFEGQSFLPTRYGIDTVPSEFPVFYKPKVGHSAIGTGILDSKNEFDEAVSAVGFLESNIVTEFLPGPEITVDCFSTRLRGLIVAKQRLRLRSIDGLAVETEDYFSPEVEEIVLKLASSLSWHGAWFAQFKQDKKGTFKLLEIAARQAGASGLRRAQGINFCHMSILAHDGIDLEILDQANFLRSEISNGDFVFRSEQKFGFLYVDLDDTLLLHGSVNRPVFELIQKAKRHGALVTLLTRSVEDPIVVLRRHDVESLFDRVVHITDGSPKERFIPEKGMSLFVDDSFRERKSALSRRDIVAVDASACFGAGGFFDDA